MAFSDLDPKNSLAFFICKSSTLDSRFLQQSDSVAGQDWDPQSEPSNAARIFFECS